MKSFQKQRRLLRKAFEDWARNTLEFVENQHHNNQKEWPKIHEKLKDALSRENGIKAETYTRDKSGKWLEINHNNYIWYFVTDQFVLQPYFISREKKASETGFMERLGYIDYEYPCMKYIKPFTENEIPRAVNELKKEFEMVEKLW